ncbi:MAG: Fe-S cluster assembly protein SufB [Erysipelothrix sp.]|nr:Fe-S cluster assembly protein SufB [Erysipelothrix sp.]
MSSHDEKLLPQGDYKYGFQDEDTSVFNTGKGLTAEVVREISAIKNEPKWMLEFRLKAYEHFKAQPLQDWGPRLDHVNFDDYTYYVRPSDRVEKSWDDVPQTIKDTFEKLGIPEDERAFLAGVATQYDSEVVYSSMLKEVEDKGVIFLDTDTALREHPEIFKKYFDSVVPYNDNKFSALNGAVWSGGSFIYVPKGVKLEKPLQSYFRINTERMGQFERTLIIVDEGAEVNYVEGCTAPIYSNDSLHAAVVEIVVLEGGKCRYSTVQNWSSNILNLVTKRAHVEAHAVMEWIDGNIGSSINMKYPSCILKGEYARGLTIAIAVASDDQIQDSGAKMIHLAPHTSSTIIAKSIGRRGGEASYRGKIYMGENAAYSRSKIECDTLLMDPESSSDTIPDNVVKNNSSYIEHEASVSKISEEQLFYLMSRGLEEEEATELIIMGFIEPFTRELPMEYAVELNQLMKLEMEGSIG